MRMFCALVVVGMSTGCKEQKPTTVHGKSVSYWVQALQDHDTRVRKKALESLGNVGAADPAAIPALIGALKDNDAAVRAAATLALLKIGPDAQDAAEALAEAQKDKDPKVRDLAAKALQRVQGNK
jgi:HEAT repeat protein